MPSCRRIVFWLKFFFFQAEDGIRDVAVTGVQTCALPISNRRTGARRDADVSSDYIQVIFDTYHDHIGRLFFWVNPSGVKRSEERRVGKECRSRWSPYH